MFVLFTLFKLTSDERKTLTKISTCKTSHNHSPKPAHASDMKEQENQQTAKTRKRRKGHLHNWWRIQSIRISSENTRKKKQPPTRGSQLVLYKKYYVISFPCKINNRAVLTKSKIHMFKISLYKIYRFHFSSKYKIKDSYVQNQLV